MSKTISFNYSYLTPSQKRLFLIMPRWYIGIFSRGTGKTTVKQALRSLLTAENVPGGLSVFYNATYIGAQQRTVSDTLKGWKEFGLVEGRDFVKNTAPPVHFGKSQYQPLNYKNVITHKSGHSFIIASNDRPGLVNSLSITGGIFVDECRFINGELMKQDLYPAIRGKNVWGKYNPFVFSRTYTTDMPFIGDETEWLHDFEKMMNPNQIRLIAQASIKVELLKNKILKYRKLYQASGNYSVKRNHLSKIESLSKRLTYKIGMLNKIRSVYITSENGKQIKTNKSVYFDTGSFLANLNILGRDYFFDNADPERNPLIAKTSFLNIKPSEVENKFYSNLKTKHFITGRFDGTAIYEFGIRDAEEPSPLKAIHILDYDPTKELDIEFDYGDMCSCSISQTFGNKELYIASFEVILPFDIDDLIQIVLAYFKQHAYKRINVYKDPSGNYQRNRKSRVYGLQTVEGFRSAGWYVIDKCPMGTINPPHTDKHRLISMILKETDPQFPIVRIIRETNRQLESSMSKAPLIVKYKQDGSKEMLKDKTSERILALKDKPMNSTDHSDHFDIKMWHKYNHLLPYSGLSFS